MNTDCCKEPRNWDHEVFKHTLHSATGFYYTVYLQTCSCCGKVIDKGTWVE